MLFYAYINIFVSVSNARIQTEPPLMKKANIEYLLILALSIRLHFFIRKYALVVEQS